VLRYEAYTSHGMPADPRRVHAVSASSSASRSDGFMQPSVLRGRSLRLRPILARSSTVHGQVGSFGQALAEQSVGVLMGPTLPGVVRIAEVDRMPAATVNPTRY
jgi:hypothetical protein